MTNNPINISGNDLEEQIKNFLISKNIPFNKTNGIDFIINTNAGDIYVEAKNQNTGGSVEEKLPFTVWKYKNQYKINHMIIVHGKHNISKRVRKCILEMQGIDVDFYDFQDFCKLIDGEQVHGSLDLCMS
tara:strand:+ start:97 stop:486 length:390 start_codon:yes stop_codon:yes gene_type:complete